MLLSLRPPQTRFDLSFLPRPRIREGHRCSFAIQGYTTRFELRHVSADTKSHPLAEDFKEAFLAEHGTSLAILATKARLSILFCVLDSSDSVVVIGLEGALFSGHHRRDSPVLAVQHR